MAIDSDELAALRRAREEFLETGCCPGSVRAEIVASWRRSARSGVSPDRARPTFEPDLEHEEHLLSAARPVLERLAAELAGTGTSVLLADRRARIVERWADDPGLLDLLDRSDSQPGAVLAEDVAGTNGLGTALERGGPVAVRGGEHFTATYQAFTCVGVPLRHPLTRRIAGIVDLTCRAEDTNPLLLPLVLEAEREIEARLAERVSIRDRRLLHAFLAATKASSHPVVALNDRVLIASPRAARLLDGIGPPQLWEQALRWLGRDAPDGADRQVGGPGPGVRLRARLALGDATTGVVVEVEDGGDPRPAGRRQATGRRPARAAGELPGLAGRSPAWRRLLGALLAAERTGMPIVLVGEAGAGKLAVARAVHARRDDGTHLEVHDAALATVEGDGWWRRLDTALGDASATVVVRHLDALAGPGHRALGALVGRPDGRARCLATATSDDATGAVPVPAWAFPVAVPALRERVEDLVDLVAALTARHGGPGRWWSPEALQALARLPWPGNVAQLEQVVRRVLAVRPRGEIGPGDLPEDVRQAGAPRPLGGLERAELHAVLAALAAVGGNKVRAAELLGISRSRLYRKLRAFGVEPA